MGEAEKVTTAGVFECHDNSGRNESPCHGNTMARRSDSYNQRPVISAKPLPRETLLQVLILHLNHKWSASLSLGVTALSPASVHLPVTQLGLKRDSWLISGDGVYHNGVKIRSSLLAGHTLGLVVTSDNCLHLAWIADNIPNIVLVAGCRLTRSPFLTTLGRMKGASSRRSVTRRRRRA